MFAKEMNTRDLLSVLWIFLMVNYLFCDIFTLHYAPMLQMFLEGKVGGIELNQEFLLTFAVILELPMLMIVLSKVMNYRIARYANLAVAAFMTLQQSATLTMGFTLHYLFFSIFEISASALIFVIAWRWKQQPSTQESLS